MPRAGCSGYRLWITGSSARAVTLSCGSAASWSSPNGGDNGSLDRPLTSVVGTRFAHVLARVAVTAILSVGIAGPLRDVAVASDTGGPIAAPMPVHADPIADLPDRPAPKGFTDEAARVSLAPPVGWVREPSEALNPLSDPPDPAQELVRFQLRAGDPSLYLLPVPITSALVRDAGAIISVGLARADGDMLDLDVDPRTDRAEVSPVAGFFHVDDERTYEGLHLFTRN